MRQVLSRMSVWRSHVALDSSNVGVGKAPDTGGESRKRPREVSTPDVVNFGDAESGSQSAPRPRAGRFTTAFAGFFGGVSAMVARTAAAIGVSSRVAGIGMAALALTAGAGGVALVANSFDTNTYMQTLWVDDEECVDYLTDAKKDLGGGVTEIPETMVGDDGKTYKVGYIATWEGRVKALRGLNLTGDVLKMANFYDANGGRTDEAGFERIGELYIVALGQGPFRAEDAKTMHDGDLVTIEFDDGTSIGALVGDQKGRHNVEDPYDPSTFNVICSGASPTGDETTCGWGHIVGDEVNVLEFWGYDDSGNPMTGALQKSTGGTMTRVVSITNHGMSSEFANFEPKSTAVEGATASMKDLKTSKAASAMEECETHPNYDNSTLVSALVSYSYSQARTQPNSEPSTALYQEVCEAVLGTEDCTAPMHYHSCDRGVAAAVRWTGADLNFPAGACAEQYDYCMDHPELWELVWPKDATKANHGGVPITGNDDFAESIGLEPGDIGISWGEHTLAYVGHDAIVEGYETFIKGHDGTRPGTGGDIGEPDPNSAWVMASYGERGAGIQCMLDDRPYAFFRYKGDYPDADKYANVGSSATISGTTSRGTSCDCGEEPEDCENEGAAEIIAQVMEHISDDDSHGYSQDNRLGDGTTETIKAGGQKVTIHGGDYDCSSAVSQACIAAGLITEDQTFWTGSEEETLLAAGFTKMDFTPSAAKRGDVLWMPGHTGVCIGDGQQADAGYDEVGGISGPTKGDQNGQEHSRKALWGGSWVYIFRPPSSGGHASCADSSKISGKGSLTDEQREKIVQFAESQIGVPYNYGDEPGGVGGLWSNDIPNQQLACNGLTYWSYNAAGVEIPRGSREQMAGGPVVTSTGRVSDMSPGDIVCWDPSGLRDDVDDIRIFGMRHVAIYAGNGEIIEGTMPCAQRRQISDNEYSYSITW